MSNRAVHAAQDVHETEASPSTDPFSTRPQAGVGTSHGEVSFAATRSFASAARLDSEAMVACQAVPGYEIVGELGRGGMGLVLRGRDAELGRDVAVKVLLERHDDRPDLAQRFIEEAQINGQLQHPGVVPVYELGKLTDQRPYFAMKLVEGRTLAELLKARSDPAQDRARFIKIFEQVCQTLAYAHARRVIHRDLKPGNVMVGAFGEVQVMDWGLGKVLAADHLDPDADSSSATLHTLRSSHAAAAYSTQVGLGTPAYMPPEQALGDADRVNERSDVFGLGAILCEILTGGPPRLKLATDDMRDGTRRADLSDALARLKACGADKELLAIAVSCLAADPADRPRDAGVVAAAVTDYLESVAARLRQSELDRAAAQVQAREERKRRKLTIGLASAIVVVLALLGGAAVWLQAQRGETERNAALALAKAQQLQAHAAAMPRDTSQQAAAALAVGRQAQAAVEQAAAVLDNGFAGDELRARVEASTHDLRDWLTTAAAEQTQLAREEKLLRDLEAARLARMAWKQSGVLANAEAIGQIAPRLADRTRGFDYAGSVALYEQAFAEYGWQFIDQKFGTLTEEIARLSPHFRRAMVSALDDWTFAAGMLENEQRSVSPSSWALSQLAERLDDDDWSKLRRQAARSGDAALLKRAVAEAERCVAPAASLELLSYNLNFHQLREESLRLLRWARQEQPGDFWLHLSLGNALLAQIDRAPAEVVEECLGCYRTAVALRPDSPVAHFNLAGALQAKPDAAAAMAEYRRAIGLDPDFAEAHYNLGLALAAEGDMTNAVSEFQRATALRPEDAEALTNLGFAWAGLGDFAAAIEAYRRAIAVDSRFFRAHNNLGLALAAQGDHQAAMAAYRRAIELKPDYAEVHFNLGISLFVQGDVAAAITSYQQALQFKATFAEAHTNLGIALAARGDVAAAIAAYHRALEINPDLAPAHANLAIALAHEGELESALAEFRRVAELTPRDPDAHVNLGLALAANNDSAGAAAAHQSALLLDPHSVRAHGAFGAALANCGRFKEAREATQRYLELLADDDPARAQASALLEYCERFVAVEAALDAALTGERQALANVRVSDLAELCVLQCRYAAAVRFFQELFAAQPEIEHDLESKHRFVAASCAALAASGRGIDAANLSDGERQALRRLALGWLQTDLSSWKRRLSGSADAERQAILKKLDQWRTNPDLAGIRAPERLDRLMPDEQAAFRSLWSDVFALLEGVASEPYCAP